MIERQTHLENRQTSLINKQKTSRHTKNVSNSVSRRKQSADDKQGRNASHRRQETTKKRRAAVQNSSESLQKLFRNSHGEDTSALNDVQARSEAWTGQIAGTTPRDPGAHSSLRGRGVEGSKNYFCLKRVNPVRKLGVKFFGDLMCLKWNFWPN